MGKAIDGLRPSIIQRKLTEHQGEFKILVADDNPDSLRLLSSRLQNEGYQFIPAWNGEETLEKARSESPDLILLDVNMPKKNGFQALEEIRADASISHIPVIVISAARIGPKDIRDGFSLGADDYVIKPFDWRELAVRIQSKLRVKQAEDILRRRNLELETLQDISQRLIRSNSFEDIADAMLSRLNRVLGAAWARLDIRQGADFVFYRMEYAIKASSSSLPSLQDQFPSLGIISQVISDQQALLIDDTHVEQGLQELAEAGVGALMVVPLVYRDCLNGILSISHCQPDSIFRRAIGVGTYHCLSSCPGG